MRQSPYKVRALINVIRRLPVAAALDQLHFVNKRAAGPVIKLINSGVANAVSTYNLDKDNLYIKEIRADEAGSLKRWLPRAHGRATPLKKRACHLFLLLAEIKPSGKKEKKALKAAEPVKLEKLAKQSQKSAKKIKPEKAADRPIKTGAQSEKGKEIIEPRWEGRRAHAPIEGGASKGFVSKIFRRKSG